MQPESEARVVALRDHRGHPTEHMPAYTSARPAQGTGLTGTDQRGGALWEAASGRFSPSRLRTAIVARRWTVPAFAAAAGIGRATAYRAVGGTAVSDQTVVKVLSALESRSPSGLIDG